MAYCAYYQADVEKKECWYFVALIRSFEHLAFDRTLNKNTSTFEFFVPIDNESYFVSIMQYFQTIGIVSNFQKMPNRLENPDAIL